MKSIARAAPSLRTGLVDRLGDAPAAPDRKLADGVDGGAGRGVDADRAGDHGGEEAGSVISTVGCRADAGPRSTWMPRSHSDAGADRRVELRPAVLLGADHDTWRVRR